MRGRDFGGMDWHYYENFGFDEWDDSELRGHLVEAFGRKKPGTIRWIEGTKYERYVIIEAAMRWRAAYEEGRITPRKDDE